MVKPTGSPPSWSNLLSYGREKVGRVAMKVSTQQSWWRPLCTSGIEPHGFILKFGFVVTRVVEWPVPFMICDADCNRFHGSNKLVGCGWTEPAEPFQTWFVSLGGKAFNLDLQIGPTALYGFDARGSVAWFSLIQGWLWLDRNADLFTNLQIRPTTIHT